MLHHSASTSEKVAAIPLLAGCFKSNHEVQGWPGSKSGNQLFIKKPLILSPMPIHSSQEHPAVKYKPVELTLDESGMILDCCVSGEGLFECSRDELIEQHVSKLFPKLSEIKLVTDGELNPQLGFLCRCSQRFLTRRTYRADFSSELSFVFLKNGGMNILRLIVQP